MKLKTCFLTSCFAILASLTCWPQKGKDHAQSYTTAGTYILNRYTTLAGTDAAGSMSAVVSNIADLNGSNSFTNSVNPYAVDALSAGDLILIVQVQGATIGTSNTAAYGTISAYNNTGNYEVKYVNSVSGNVINFCTALANTYSVGGTLRTEVVRVPRLVSLTVGAGVTLTGTTWSAATGTGGVVALEVRGNITLNGSISAGAIGFNGGADPLPGTSSPPGAGVITVYRTTATNNAAGKGESIAGSAADLASLLGAMGRGAPANGGGGGNGHNGGGGGGSNAGTAAVLAPYNGTGLKDISIAAWANAWNLEAAGFSTDVSVGGGRGGYTYSSSDQDALTLATSNAAWGGDYRDNEGGFGGHPLNYNGDTRLFMGGGGGGGDGNDNVPGNGGNGGGIAYILCNGNISGAGILSAGGQDGYPTFGTNMDASGGGGGGGAVNALVSGTITGISITANGGNGGSQPFIAVEAEGPGGGGGGGYVATTTTAVTRQVNGGGNGTTASAHLTEFLPNGATKGNAGTSVTKTFADVEDCGLVLLPVQFASLTAAAAPSAVSLAWSTGADISNSFFSIERSSNGSAYATVGTTTGLWFNDNALPGDTTVFFYRIRQTSVDGRYTYSSVVRVDLGGKNAVELAIMPNPVKEYLQVTYNAPEQGSVHAAVFNENGLAVRALSVAVSKGFNSFTINDLGQLPPGRYMLRVQDSREVLNKSFIILR